MSSVTHPVEKKRLAYLKDHYVRGGASPQNWRKVKSFKKAKASRAFRKLHKSLERHCADAEAAPFASIRRLEGLKKSRVYQGGSFHLKQFVEHRLEKRQDMIGARKRRQAKRDQVQALLISIP
ncbi:hypothetical protein [Luteolibacter luteus]|uniref:Uncharacterized protein n=1 Tax=Luteolibacter luteus TaxID=2728835 RepID=A0A858RPD3_9BACT|nr:hypothetical protein [Luteolibacter luteus]QJE98209.1 hypothetical protein HHL09_21270 [Luteolibacter luteus]